MQMNNLKNIGSLLCLKLLNPENYGSFQYTKYLSKDELHDMMSITNQIILDKQNSSDFYIDKAHAEEVIMNICVSKLACVTQRIFNYFKYLSNYVFICQLISMYNVHYGESHD